MSDDKKLSRKDLAKQLRREAYQKAKEKRANDPKVIAMKEAAKVHRREAYRKAKDRKKAIAAETKAKKKREAVEEREVKDAELLKLVRRGTKGSFGVN